MKRFLNFKSGIVVFALMTVLLFFSGEIMLFIWAFITAAFCAACAAACISEVLAKKSHKDGFLIFAAVMAAVTALTIAFGTYDLKTADSETFLDGIFGTWALMFTVPTEVITIVAAFIVRAVKKRNGQ